MKKKQIKGQVIYMGPHVRHLGLNYSAIFRNGVTKHLLEAADQCAALGELFIPVANCGAVRKELAFDYAHNMKGTVGRHVTFYREVQKWLASTQQQKPNSPSSGLTIEPQSHA